MEPYNFANYMNDLTEKHFNQEKKNVIVLRLLGDFNADLLISRFDIFKCFYTTHKMTTLN